MSKVVVITGASGGIGSACCKKFSDNGYIVYGISRRKSQHGYCKDIECDILDIECVNRSINAIIEKEGKIDILINNAGMGVSGPVETCSIDKARKQFDVNYFGTINMIQTVLPYMRDKRSGTIINISSLGSKIGIPFQSHYSASKSSIDAMAFSLALEVKEFNVKVCNVLPGDTKTNFTGERQKDSLEGAKEYAISMEHAVSVMEKDEANGMSPDTVANVVFKQSRKKHPKLQVVVGFKNKVLAVLIKLLPIKLAAFVVKKIYIR